MNTGNIAAAAPHASVLRDALDDVVTELWEIRLLVHAVTLIAETRKDEDGEAIAVVASSAWHKIVDMSQRHKEIHQLAIAMCNAPEGGAA